MEESPLPEDVVAELRSLAHDLSNSLETILQASYLLSQSSSDPSNRRWAGMIETASREAAQINRKIREILRAHA